MLRVSSKGSALLVAGNADNARKTPAPRESSKHGPVVLRNWPTEFAPGRCSTNSRSLEMSLLNVCANERREHLALFRGNTLLCSEGTPTWFTPDVSPRIWLMEMSSSCKIEDTIYISSIYPLTVFTGMQGVIVSLLSVSHTVPSGRSPTHPLLQTNPPTNTWLLFV